MEKPFADPIVFSSPISSLKFRRKIAEVRGRQRSTHLSGIAENINLFVVTIGKVCKQQAGGLALQRRLGCQAGKQCNNAKCQVCLHSECGQRRAPQKSWGRHSAANSHFLPRKPGGFNPRNNRKSSRDHYDSRTGLNIIF